MHTLSEWHTALCEQGANTQQHPTIDFSHITPNNTPLPEQGIVINSDLALLEIQGTDAMKFLQGQVSSDLRHLTLEDSQLSSYNSPKGRIMTLMRILKRAENHFFIILPVELKDFILKRMSMFIMRSDVKINDISEQWAIWGHFNNDSSEKGLTKFFKDLPVAINKVSQQSSTTIVSIGNMSERYLFLTPAEDINSLWVSVAKDYKPVSYLFWHLLDIRDGIPSVVESSSEAFVAQMVNMQLLGGVSFKKGCYTGQEVIARMQHLGTLKRQMYHAKVKCNHQPIPGDAIGSEHSKSGQGAGKVVSVVAIDHSEYEILAVLEISSIIAGPLYLEKDHDAILNIIPLPYEHQV